MSDGLPGFIFGLMLIFLAAMFFTVRQTDKLKEDAVKRGFAEWVVSSAGEVKWQWKEEAR